MSLAAHARNFPGIVQIALLLTFSSVFTMSGQTLAIKLIDGRNGHPIANACVNVWVGDERKYPLTIPTDTNGAARMRLTKDSAEIKTDNSWTSCGDRGVINPVVQYNDLFKVNVGYVVCEPHGTDFSWLEVKGLSTSAVMQTGVVTAIPAGSPPLRPHQGK